MTKITVRYRAEMHDGRSAEVERVYRVDVLDDATAERIVDGMFELLEREFEMSAADSTDSKGKGET